MRRTLRHLQARFGHHPKPLPHFLVIGTQKGGTTSLHHLLSRHPGIYLPAVKEVHYFSQHFHQSRQWYADHYQDAKPGQVRGWLEWCSSRQRLVALLEAKPFFTKIHQHQVSKPQFLLQIA
jgi:hypothetical protein